MVKSKFSTKFVMLWEENRIPFILHYEKPLS